MYIQVDEFDLEEYRQRGLLLGQPTDCEALDSSIVEALECDVTDEEVTPEDVGDGVPVPRGDGVPDRVDGGEADADEPKPHGAT
jgi:acyl-CoA dehydrogenase